MLELLMLIILVGVLVGYFLFLTDTILGSNDLATSTRACEKIFDIIQAHAPFGAICYDLGCARGFFAMSLQKRIPHLRVYGIDNHRIRIILAKIRGWVHQSPTVFMRGDFFAINLSEADVVYAYLLKELMPELEKKLREELKAGAVIITNTSFFPYWEPIETIVTYPAEERFEKLFIYKKGEPHQALFS
ncbi:MAG: hypothetical protein KGI50_03800 [Patescibacteria group bacterium]|nr:hypothetical protein [Patescibacteria group bacterium]MDE2438413.1 hypothetical protein [Patescibacteria group bacterium]